MSNTTSPRAAAASARPAGASPRGSGIVIYGPGTSCAVDAALLTVLAVPALLPWARRVGLVDVPGGRRRHTGAVPLIGGLAIYLAVLAAALGGLTPGGAAFVALAGAAVAAGLLDDRYRLPPAAKLICQFAIAAAAVFWAGREVGDAGRLLHVEAIAPNLFDATFSVLFYVALMNAMNLIDGADGVAAGVAAAALIGLLAIAAAWHTGGDALVWVELGAVGGFLVYNAPLPRRGRPTAFLGDAGSMVIGFSLAWFSIDLHQHAPQVSPVALAWVLAIPVIDMGCVTVARLLRGTSPFTGGRDHLHHLLLDRGLSRGVTALIVTLLSATFAAIGIVGARLGLHDAVSGAALFAVAMLYGALTGALRTPGADMPALPVAVTAWRRTAAVAAPASRPRHRSETAA